jgi:hypothetical protein
MRKARNGFKGKHADEVAPGKTFARKLLVNKKGIFLEYDVKSLNLRGKQMDENVFCEGCGRRIEQECFDFDYHDICAWVSFGLCFCCFEDSFSVSLIDVFVYRGIAHFRGGKLAEKELLYFEKINNLSFAFLKKLITKKGV